MSCPRLRAEASSDVPASWKTGALSLEQVVLLLCRDRTIAQERAHVCVRGSERQVHQNTHSWSVESINICLNILCGSVVIRSSCRAHFLVHTRTLQTVMAGHMRSALLLLQPCQTCFTFSSEPSSRQGRVKETGLLLQAALR